MNCKYTYGVENSELQKKWLLALYHTFRFDSYLRDMCMHICCWSPRSLACQHAPFLASTLGCVQIRVDLRDATVALSLVFHLQMFLFISDIFWLTCHLSPRSPTCLLAQFLASSLLVCADSRVAAASVPPSGRLDVGAPVQLNYLSRSSSLGCLLAQNLPSSLGIC
jgi:hypothetical protein